MGMSLLAVEERWQCLEMRAGCNRHWVHAPAPLSSSPQEPELRPASPGSLSHCSRPDSRSPSTVYHYSLPTQCIPSLTLWDGWLFHMCLSGRSNRLLTPKKQKTCFTLTSLFSSREPINILCEYYRSLTCTEWNLYHPAYISCWVSYVGY